VDGEPDPAGLGSEGIRVGDRMPMIWGLSKSAANYRPATRPELRCAECKFMFPRLAIGGCRYVRGVIHAGDLCDEFVPRRGQRLPPGS
jgi:hypothetical protein